MWPDTSHFEKFQKASLGTEVHKRALNFIEILFKVLGSDRVGTETL